MPGISFSQKDLAASNQLPAGWYKLNVDDISEGAGKKDPTSTTWTCQFSVAEGEFAMTPIPHWFSSKMMENAARYLHCFIGNLEAGKVYPIEETKGRQVMGYCYFDLENNRNSIKDFKRIQ